MMAKINKEDLPFIRFADIASQESYHDHPGTIYERVFHMLWVPEKSPTFHANLEELGLGPLVEAPLTSCSGWVRDFYIFLPIVHWDDPNSTIYI